MSEKLSLVVLPLILVVFVPASAQTIKDFPEGPGKQFVTQICLQCHEPMFLLQQRRTEADWKMTVHRMSQKGLGGPTENYDAVAVYMFKNFGKVEETDTKVNINKATVDEIVARLGFTKEEAAALVAYRDQEGSFREWGDILVVYGVDGRKVEAAKDKMSF